MAVLPEPLIGYRRHPGGQSVRADIQLRWFETLAEWLRRAGDAVPVADRERYLRAGRERLTVRANALYWSRDWDAHDRYAARLAADGPPPPGLLRRSYPRWVYRLKDAVDARVRPGQPA